jgi:hypothetical protein
LGDFFPMEIWSENVERAREMGAVVCPSA